MADIVTSRTFVDGEKNITAQKLNDIVASSVIQPAFVSAKPATSTVATTDNLLILTAAGGTYAKAPFQTIIDSVNTNLNTNAAIWSVRLRSFNAIGNPTFEVRQRNAGGTLTNPADNTIIEDRWTVAKGSATLGYSIATQGAGLLPGGGVVIPGTNFAISTIFMRITLLTQQTTLAAGDLFRLYQIIEGPRLRELLSDVHSIQVLVRSSVAGLSFGVGLRSPDATSSLIKLCTIPSANTWTLIPLPNIPVWSGGNFTSAVANAGYFFTFCLAAGSTFMAPALNTWQNGNFYGAPGQSNFAASPVNSTFDIAFVQHEPGALCSTPMDCSFTQNYADCLRYYRKTYDYPTPIGTATTSGELFFYSAGAQYAMGNWQYNLAKSPTVTVYNTTSGASNSITSFPGNVAYPVTSMESSPKTLSYVSGSTMIASQLYRFQAVADTGW